jgi:hypothetical protein
MKLHKDSPADPSQSGNIGIPPVSAFKICVENANIKDMANGFRFN